MHGDTVSASEHESNPSEHEQPEPLAHYVTIKAVLPLGPTDPAAWDRGDLREHLLAYPEQSEEVTIVRLIPEPAQPLVEWRSPDTGLTEAEDSERGH